MLTLTPELSAVFLFGLGFLLLATGLPIAFALGGAGLLAAYILWGPSSIMIAYNCVYGLAKNFALVALPLFILMGCLLQGSGIIERLFECASKWMGKLGGGIAAATIAASTIMAAMTGVTGAACVSMGLVAFPAMVKHHYDRRLAMGSIMAGAALGVLIPPSVIMILYAAYSSTSVGRLFAGGVLPGFLLAGVYVVFVMMLCRLRPEFGPGLSEGVSMKEKLASLRYVFLPACIVVSVLGSIFMGIATPTEAAGVGVAGVIISIIVNRKFSWKLCKEAARTTLQTSTMVIWLVVGATLFTSVFIAIGGPELAKGWIGGLGMNRYAILAITQFSWIILGGLLDPVAILYLTIPVYLPIIMAVGFDPVWFGVVFVVNMEMAYLTPPFGMNLFYMRATIPKDISMQDIYISALPFVGLQFVGLVLVTVFPQIILWLPTVIFH